MSNNQYTIVRTIKLSEDVIETRTRLDHAVKLAHKLTIESRNTWMTVEVLEGTLSHHTPLLTLVNVHDTVQIKKLSGTGKQRTIIVDTLSKMEK